MISTIHDFATTERPKYPPPSELYPPKSSHLFSDNLCDKYPDNLDSWNQELSNWTRAADEDMNGDPTYNTAHGRFADVVKILIHENEMETLLMLANHPFVPLSHLNHLTWGHHFGVSRIVEAALPLYIFWNFMAASGSLATEAYRNELYVNLATNMTMTMDYDAQEAPHWGFFGVKDFHGGKDDLPELDVSRLREYLKHLFSLLYRYTMVMAECGVDTAAELENEIVLSISSTYGARTETKENEQGRWRIQFA
ncbi:hypothetical protein NP233_g2017 [Leucocoprinus birnbaumii]|uniref:Uncharacterized protein n=1 Tax=Leucocoprinus birnbaumii TaxID=56174 RepID=A0AAD5YU76_9AGAR|nr:hypothetical protein NP233_g2017 [Leucocoprinus birnbaumii]